MGESQAIVESSAILPMFWYLIKTSVNTRPFSDWCEITLIQNITNEQFDGYGRDIHMHISLNKVLLKFYLQVFVNESIFIWMYTLKEEIW